MNKKSGFTLVEIMIVIAIMCVLALLAFPAYLKTRVIASDALARRTLREISTAIELYATANHGIYPTDEMDLTIVTPPYLSRTYCNATIRGFMYGCNLMEKGYLVYAQPVEVNRTGTTTYTIQTGGILQ